MPASMDSGSATQQPHTDPDAKQERPQFESWGRYPEYAAEVRELHWQNDFPRVIEGVHNGVLPVGSRCDVRADS